MRQAGCPPPRLRSIAAGSEPRATVNAHSVPGDPAGAVGCEESDYGSNVIRLRNALQSLHAQRPFPAGLRSRKRRHVRFNNPGSHGIDADPTRPEGERKLFDQRVDSSLSGRIGREYLRGSVRRHGGNQRDAASVMQHGKELLYEKKRRAHIDGKHLVEVLRGRLLDGRSLGYTGIGDEDIQALTKSCTSLCSELVRSVRGGKVRLHSLSPTTGLADASHNRIGLRFAAAVVYECPGACGRQSDGGGTPYPTRRAGNERRFSDQSYIRVRRRNGP